MIVVLIDCSIANGPILIASPYPFNTSKSSRIECFSNDQGIILSLTVIVLMLNIEQNTPLLKYTKKNVKNNESVILRIPALFNYSALSPEIQCHSKYYHGEEKTSKLEVLSVAKIVQKEYVIINTYTKENVTISCVTYGTNVVINWNFSKKILRSKFGSLPIGIRFHNRFIFNDTLIIDHVSYSDHYGYYRCYVSNKLLGITYNDESITYLHVRKYATWIKIIIVFATIGMFILILIRCIKYFQKAYKHKKIDKTEIFHNYERAIDKRNKCLPNQESIGYKSYYNHQTSSERIIQNGESLRLQQVNVETLSYPENPTHSQIFPLSNNEQQKVITFINSQNISQYSERFILGNPFFDANVEPCV